MNNTNQERYLRNFIMALTAVVLLFVVLPAQADTCVRADQQACEDLIGAEVFFERVSRHQFVEACGVHPDNADACARLNISRRQCTIYYKTHAIEKAVYEHEMNHCRGWFHKSRDNRTYHRPWVDYKTFLGE